MPATPSRPCRRAPARRLSRVRTTAFKAAEQDGFGRDREGGGGCRPRHLEIRRRGIVEIRTPRTHLGENHHLRRTRPAIGREFQAVGEDRRQAARRGRRQPRRGRCRLRSKRLPGGPDRQGRGPRSLHRGGHFRRDPASGRHEGFQDHRRHQQGRGSADLPDRRLRPGGRSFQGDTGNGRTTLSKLRHVEEAHVGRTNGAATA